MKTDDSSPRPSLRRPQDGAVLVVVLLAMIGLLGMGLAGLYLTSGSIQMNSNINMRNQALYVAEAGIQTAKGIINRTVLGSPDWNPDINGMLAGIHSPSGAVVATPSGYTDEIPGRAGTDPSDYGCSGKSSNGVSTRGAYLRDEDPPPSGFGCQTDPTAPLQPVYIGCYYPPKYSGSTLAYNEAPADPNAMSPTPTQYMGQYTLFIRQDLGECRLGGDNLTRDGNNIVVIRSEGTASDNRTKVVLEVTMSTNPNVQILSQGLATVCPAGAAGCDDNASVQQGITVGPPGGGGAGGTTGGSGGTTGSACSKTSDCPTGYFCCDGACMSATDNSLHCGACEAKCAGGHCCDNNCCASSDRPAATAPTALPAWQAKAVPRILAAASAALTVPPQARLPAAPTPPAQPTSASTRPPIPTTVASAAPSAQPHKAAAQATASTRPPTATTVASAAIAAAAQDSAASVLAAAVDRFVAAVAARRTQGVLQSLQ
jgi:hypothetical protein